MEGVSHNGFSVQDPKVKEQAWRNFEAMGNMNLRMRYISAKQ